jgi:hypothetical protein
MHAALGEDLIVAGTTPGAQHARMPVDYAPSQPEPLAGRNRQTGADVPLRLDEALRYAVARIEKDPHKIEIIISFLGWGGRAERSLQELNPSVSLNAEQVVPTVACAIDRLRQTGFVPEAVQRALILAERLVPVLDTELNEALLDAKICYQRFACDGLVSAAEIFRETSPFEAVVVGTHQALVKSGTAEGISQLAALARRTVQTRGCANVDSLAEDSQEIFGSSARSC